MFIPLGFGNFPRRFPVMTLGLFVFIIMISFHYFPQIHSLSLLPPASQDPKVVTEIEAAKKLAIYEACLVTFDVDDFCLVLQQNQGPAASAKKNQWSLGSYYKMFNFFIKTAMPTQQWPKEYKTTEAFRALVQIEQKYLLQQSNPYLQLGVASSENITWSSLFLSSVIHHNIGHLFGNMILFLFLATWVEQKIRAVSTLLLFFSGSFAGFLWQVNGVPIVPTYGASAGVYAIMGAFFVFFYRTHLSVLFFYFFYFKKILLPATFYFPVIFFYNDLIHLALDSSTGVAHRAHLGGLLVGMLYAWLIKKKEHLHPDQFFSEEKILVQKIKTAKSFQECWEPFFELMKWNVQNHQGLKDFLIKWRDFKAPITSQQKKFIEKKLKIYFHLAAHKNEFSMITGLLKLIPSAISLPVIFKDISLKKILLLADRLSKQKEWSGAKRLYLLALTHKLSQFMKTKISQTLSEIDNQEREIEIGDKV